MVSSVFVDIPDTWRAETLQFGDMTNLKAIGRRVRELREDEGVGQEELAASIGVSRSTIAGIETGGDRGGILTMVAIADHYKVPMDWLLCRDVPPGGPPIGKFIDRADQLALFDFWEGLDPSERAAAVRLLRIPLPRQVA